MGGGLGAELSWGCRHHADGKRFAFRLWLTYSCFFLFLYSGRVLTSFCSASLVLPPFLGFSLSLALSLSELKANWLPAFHRYLLSPFSGCLRVSPLPPSSLHSWRMINIREARGTFQREWTGEQVRKRKDSGKYHQQRLESLSEDHISRLVGHSWFYFWLDCFADIAQIEELSLYSVFISCCSAVVTRLLEMMSL